MLTPRDTARITVVLIIAGGGGARTRTWSKKAGGRVYAAASTREKLSGHSDRAANARPNHKRDSVVMIEYPQEKLDSCTLAEMTLFLFPSSLLVPK